MKILMIGLAAAAVVTLGLGYCFQDRLIATAAPFLIDSDPPQKADLIYILGGNYDVRAPYAARLYRQGWAPKILLAREPSTPAMLNGRAANFTDTTIRILEENGVPKDRIVDFSPARGVTSTADEAHVLKLYTETYPVSRVLVVTTSFHSRRARMAMNRALSGRSIQILVPTVETPDYTNQNWHRTEFGRYKVRLELTKWVYYFFTFWG